MQKRTAIVGLLGLLVVFVVLPASAGAKVTGPCTATIAGADVTQVDKVTIEPGQDVSFSFGAPSPLESYEMQLFYGPYSAAPSSGTVDGDQTSIAGTVPMKDYAWLGSGLYKLKGKVVLKDGGVCEGSINVHVNGNPLTTAVGATAAAITGATTIGLVLLFLKDAGFLFGA